MNSLQHSWSRLNRQLSLEQTDRWLRWGGHLYFGLMLVLSLYYYQERMLSMDTANYAFQLLLSGDFYTGLGRTLTYITQVLPVLAVQWGASLRTVLLVYSASFILFYYSIYLIVTYFFRNPRAGIFLALALGLTLRYKFYGPVGEVVLSMAPLALLIGWLTRPADRFAQLATWLDIGIGLLLATALLTGHPFIAVSAAIFFGFDLIHRQRWRDWQFWLIALYTGLIFRLKMLWSAGNSYAEMRMERLGDYESVLRQLPDLYITERIGWFFQTEYLLPFAVFLIALGWLIYRRLYLLAAYLLGSFVGLLLLIIVMHNYLDSPIYIMLDGYMAHLGLLWALPLAFIWLAERRLWMILLVLFLLFFSLWRIQQKHVFFRERIEYLQAILDTHTDGDQRKLLAHMDQFDWPALWMPWAISLETMMLSSLDGPQGTATLYYEQHHENWEGQLADPAFLLYLHYAPVFLQQDWLPARYFQLPKVPYRRIVVEKKQQMIGK